uniref:THIF-type NAD/FAD binding fold domain-containing protein n=1 Tax=Ditylenchus dipsaci TaxID=166011 RepID=A0A915EB51_9BILA
MSAVQCLPTAVAGASSASKTEEISKAEAELYDRQIRLWGLEAQNRLRNASVLLVGMSGLGAEIAKNLMLSGLKSLTIMDDKKVTQDDYASQFLLSPESIGENRAESSKQKTQVLNPMVPSGRGFGWVGYAFSDFNNHAFLVPKPKQSADVATLEDSDEEAEGGQPLAKKKKLNGAGQVDTVTLEDDAEQKIKKNVNFSSFDQAFNMDWSSKHCSRRMKSSIPPTFFQIRALLRLYDTSQEFTLDKLVEQWKDELNTANLDEASQRNSLEDFKFLSDPQLSPVCAIVGSIIGQEAIKSISQNDPPLKNVFLYSALDTTGIVCDLPLKL